MEHRPCLVRERAFAYRPEVARIETTLRVGDEPVFTRLKNKWCSYAKPQVRPHGEFPAVRIMGGNGYFRCLAIYEQETVHQNYSISWNSPNSFQHRLSQVYIAALDSAVNYWIEEFGKINEYTVPTFNFSVLNEWRDFIDKKRQRSRTIHAISQPVKQNQSKGCEAERHDEHVEQSKLSFQKYMHSFLMKFAA